MFFIYRNIYCGTILQNNNDTSGRGFSVKRDSRNFLIGTRTYVLHRRKASNLFFLRISKPGANKFFSPFPCVPNILSCSFPFRSEDCVGIVSPRLDYLEQRYFGTRHGIDQPPQKNASSSPGCHVWRLHSWNRKLECSIRRRSSHQSGSFVRIDSWFVVRIRYWMFVCRALDSMQR